MKKAEDGDRGTEGDRVRKKKEEIDRALKDMLTFSDTLYRFNRYTLRF